MPVDLVQRDRWVLRDEAKVPLQTNGRPAKSTDPSTWCDYDTARAAQVGVGVGFVLGGGIAAVDIDHCLDAEGRPDARARALLQRAPGAYVEISPGGDGLHIWGLAEEQAGRCTAEFEAYAVGRYVTVTGRVFRPGALVVDLSEFFRR